MVLYLEEKNYHRASVFEFNVSEYKPNFLKFKAIDGSNNFYVGTNIHLSRFVMKICPMYIDEKYVNVYMLLFKKLFSGSDKIGIHQIQRFKNHNSLFISYIVRFL